MAVKATVNWPTPDLVVSLFNLVNLNEKATGLIPVLFIYI